MIVSYGSDLWVANDSWSDFPYVDHVVTTTTGGGPRGAGRKFRYNYIGELVRKELEAMRIRQQQLPDLVPPRLRLREIMIMQHMAEQAVVEVNKRAVMATVLSEI